MAPDDQSVRVVTEASEIRDGLRMLRQQLTRQFSKPGLRVWSTPGGTEKLPTWYLEGALGPLAVAVGKDGQWGTRTPVLLACSALSDVMTPTVEVNIPFNDGAVSRAINGCLCTADRDRVVLAHRGNGLAIQRHHIPRESVQRHFAKWLQTVRDDERDSPIIPVCVIGPRMTAHMAAFAERVAGLKRAWLANKGNATKVASGSGWREILNFPKKIARALAPSKKTFEYRHGPIQSDLQKALRQLLPSDCRVVLNKHVDLAIRRGTKLLAIFEVKTNLGPQVYAGIGQLFCYRQQLAKPETRLFFVVPSDVRPADQNTYAASMLRALGIEMLLAQGAAFTSGDGRPLGEVLKFVRT